jgi:nucleoside-diphosphate-sugar epimerase
LIALVTGDTGFIGSNMKQLLIHQNIEVIGFSRKKGLNVLNKKRLYKESKKCDIIYHFAAVAKPGESILYPINTIEENLRGSLNVLEVCKELNIPLIYPSSCEVYGNSFIPITEDLPLYPTNPYSASKVAIDRFCYMYHKCYDVDVKIVRLFNPYGKKQQLNKIIPTFFFQASKGNNITVFGDGKDIRDYVYISDIVNGLWMSRKLNSGEAINLATGKSTTNFEIAKLVKDITGSDSEIVLVNYPKTFGGIKAQVGSFKKAKDLIGWKPKIKLEVGIKKTVEWLSQINLEEDK